MSHLSKTEQAFFRAAQSISLLSDHKCQIGCIIVDKHKIISSGHNSDTKCHPVQAELDTKHFNCFSTGKLHAETSAIVPLLNSKRDLSRATCYTFRQLKDGSLGMSRPCPRCLELIKQVGIRKIKYTTEDGFVTELLGGYNE